LPIRQYGTFVWDTISALPELKLATPAEVAAITREELQRWNNAVGASRAGIQFDEVHDHEWRHVPAECLVLELDSDSDGEQESDGEESDGEQDGEAAAAEEDSDGEQEASAVEEDSDGEQDAIEPVIAAPEAPPVAAAPDAPVIAAPAPPVAAPDRVAQALDDVAAAVADAAPSRRLKRMLKEVEGTPAVTGARSRRTKSDIAKEAVASACKKCHGNGCVRCGYKKSGAMLM